MFRALPFELASASQPTANFTQAAALWNGFSFTPKVDTPDADGNTRTNASTEVTVGGRFVTLGAGTPLHVAPDAGSVGSSILVTLGDTIRIEDGGSWLFCWLPASAITEGRVNADTGTSADGRDITVAQDSRVDVRSESGDRRLVKIVSGVVRATGVMAWAEIIDIRGGETTDLPIPGS